MASPDNGGDWGILGGSFDPVHNGHINLANSICQRKLLQGVLIVPAFKHPLKKQATVAAYEDRITMLKLALFGQNQLQLCEIEKVENLSGYTIDMLHALKKRFPNARFYFIIGSDLVSQLNSWHRADQLQQECSFLAGARPGEHKVEDDKIAGPMVEMVKINELDISASDIRQRIKNGAALAEINKLVPEKVAEYIYRQGLYK